MKHIKHLLFLSILCSLVLFTNCGEDSDDPVADTTPTNTTDDSTDDGTTDPVNYTLTLTASEGGTALGQMALEGGHHDDNTDEAGFVASIERHEATGTVTGKAYEGD